MLPAPALPTYSQSQQAHRHYSGGGGKEKVRQLSGKQGLWDKVNVFSPDDAHMAMNMPAYSSLAAHVF